MTKIDIPKFADETEEANWWYDNREMLSDPDCLKFAPRNPRAGGLAGRLERLRLARELAANGQVAIEMNAPLEEITGYIQYLMMNPTDRAVADRLAEQRGLSLPALLSTLVHEELTRHAVPLTQERLFTAA